MGKTFSIIALSLTLVACSGTESPRVAAMKSSDKQLGCSEIQLEINEAEFYRKQALDNKTPGLGTVVSPLGYISTYVDANRAQASADDRIDYLNRIYEINRCDEAQVYAAAPQQAPFQPVPVMQMGHQHGYGQRQYPGQQAPAPVMYGNGQYAYASPIAYQPQQEYLYTY